MSVRSSLIHACLTNPKHITKQSANENFVSRQAIFCDVVCLTLARADCDDVCSVCSSELSQRCLWMTHWPPSPAACLADAPAQPVRKHASNDWSLRLSAAGLTSMLALIIRIRRANMYKRTLHKGEHHAIFD